MFHGTPGTNNSRYLATTDQSPQLPYTMNPFPNFSCPPTTTRFTSLSPDSPNTCTPAIREMHSTISLQYPHPSFHDSSTSLLTLLRLYNHTFTSYNHTEHQSHPTMPITHTSTAATSLIFSHSKATTKDTGMCLPLTQHVSMPEEITPTHPTTSAMTDWSTDVSMTSPSDFPYQSQNSLMQ